MSEDTAGSCWPEQEACEKWWRLRRMELKQMVTVERIKQQDRVRELEQENTEMLRVLQEVYKKHSMEIEDTMDWNELGDLLHNTLCNVMGTGKYNDWVEDMEGQDNE